MLARTAAGAVAAPSTTNPLKKQQQQQFYSPLLSAVPDGYQIVPTWQMVPINRGHASPWLPRAEAQAQPSSGAARSPYVPYGSKRST
jgi:hypothetical protein